MYSVYMHVHMYISSSNEITQGPVQKFIFTISTFMSYTPLLKYNPHTNKTNLYLNQRFRHIFIDFPPLTPNALHVELKPKTTLSRDPPERHVGKVF